MILYEYKKIPSKKLSFEEIQTYDYYYVDKTRIIYNLLTQHKSTLICRPPNFGKTLMIDTIEALYLGRRELFKDLWIYNKWDWNIRRPVLRIDLSNIYDTSKDELYKHIKKDIYRSAKKSGINFNSKNFSKNRNDIKVEDFLFDCFLNKHQNTVILIDEYDRPILSSLDKKNKLEEYIQAYKNIFETFSAFKNDIEFIFLSGLSNLYSYEFKDIFRFIEDLTFDENYSTMYGFTEDELKKTFPAHISNNKINKLQLWYGSHYWNGKQIFNPESILEAFEQKYIVDYCYNVNDRDFVYEAIKHEDISFSKLKTSLEKTFEIQTLHRPIYTKNEKDFLVRTLFQHGYLTILPSSIQLRENTCKLRITNEESAVIYNKLYLRTLLVNLGPIKITNWCRYIRFGVRNNDYRLITYIMQKFIASLPAGSKYNKKARKNMLSEDILNLATTTLLFATFGPSLTKVLERCTDHDSIDVIVCYSTIPVMFAFGIRNSKDRKKGWLSQFFVLRGYHEPLFKKYGSLHCVISDILRQKRSLARLEYIHYDVTTTVDTYDF